MQYYALLDIAVQITFKSVTLVSSSSADKSCHKQQAWVKLSALQNLKLFMSCYLVKFTFWSVFFNLINGVLGLHITLGVSSHDISPRIRALKTGKVGQLTKISGQVVRTHPVHPELVSGTFVCLECQTNVPGVEQQFKYTQPAVCRNPVCNNRTNFMLDINNSKFVDFQKVTDLYLS